MLPPNFWQKTCKRGLIFLVSLAAANAVKADICHLLQLGPYAGLASSEWSEFSESGTRLVRETGRLRVTGLAAGVGCSNIAFGLNWSRNWGQRQYEGVTNRQKSVETVSDIDIHTLSGEVMYSPNSNWAVGVKAEQSTTHRDIRTTSEATGYSERFESQKFFSGVNYKTTINENIAFSVEGWLGRGGSGRVWLYLPNIEPTKLKLGASHVAQVGIALGSNDIQISESGWRWLMQLNYSAVVTKAGPRTGVVRAGRVVATANQPQTETKTVGLYATAAYHF